MLVLARRLNQSILIGEEIEIVVVEIKGDQVKLGIKAPKTVSVHRAEVLKEIQEENKKAKAEILPVDLSMLGKIIQKKK